MRERESRNKLVVGMIIRYLSSRSRNRDAQNFKNQITSISYLNLSSKELLIMRRIIKVI